MNAFLPGIGIPGQVSVAPSGQSNWWASICCNHVRRSFLNSSTVSVMLISFSRLVRPLVDLALLLLTPKRHTP